MTDSARLIAERVLDAIGQQDFILIMRAPSEDGGNNGVHMVSNIGPQAYDVIKTFAKVLAEKDLH